MANNRGRSATVDTSECIFRKRFPLALPGLERPSGLPALGVKQDRYLVDPASSHMLATKIKPCMSKYKRIYTVKLRMAH